MGQPLQTRIKLLFTAAGVDATEDITPDLLSFSYNDKETKEADEISISLKDETGKWAGTWSPDGGEEIKAYIMPGDSEKPHGTLYCGKFYVDSLSASGSPRTFTMKAISIPLNTELRRKKKSRAWEKTSLADILGKICEECNCKPVFDADDEINYDRIDQSNESNLEFLAKLCDEAGYAIKVTDEQIVVFDQEKYETMPPVKDFTVGVSDILSWEFESNQSDSYKSCSITYRDPKTNMFDKNGKKNDKAVMTYTHTDPSKGDDAQEYTIKKRAKSFDEAKRLAKKQLRKLNLNQVTGRISVIGDISLVAGSVISCNGFGNFSGKYIITEAEHSYGGSGYVTNISMRKVNGGY
jgi:phage protein D